MSFQNVVHKVTSFGTEELEQNLDWDRDRAKYIQNDWLRAIYLLFYQISTYLFAFEIGYLGFTRQLDNVDIFGFVRKGRYILQFLAIVALAVSIQLLKDKVLQTTEDPKRRKGIECLLDCMRIVTYTLTYRFLKSALIGKTKKIQLIYTGYILLALLVFFCLRKLLFWSLFISNENQEDMKMWQKRKIKELAEKDIHSKIKQINFLMDNLEKIKKEVDKANAEPKAKQDD